MPACGAVYITWLAPFLQQLSCKLVRLLRSQSNSQLSEEFHVVSETADATQAQLPHASSAAVGRPTFQAYMPARATTSAE